MKPGPIRIEVSSHGLESRCLHLTSIPAQDELTKGISASMNNEEGRASREHARASASQD